MRHTPSIVETLLETSNTFTGILWSSSLHLLMTSSQKASRPERCPVTQDRCLFRNNGQETAATTAEVALTSWLKWEASWPHFQPCGVEWELGMDIFPSHAWVLLWRPQTSPCSQLRMYSLWPLKLSRCLLWNKEGWKTQRCFRKSERNLVPHSWAPECQNLLGSTHVSSFTASETTRCSVYLQPLEVFLHSIDLYHWDRGDKVHSDRSQKPHRLGSGGFLTHWKLEGEREGQLRVCPASGVVCPCLLLFPKSFLLMPV